MINFQDLYCHMELNTNIGGSHIFRLYVIKAQMGETFLKPFKTTSQFDDNLTTKTFPESKAITVVMSLSLNQSEPLNFKRQTVHTYRRKVSLNWQVSHRRKMEFVTLEKFRLKTINLCCISSYSC